MRRRRRKRSSGLTSLIDVLFILLFASLVQARHSMERDEPADALVVDAGLPDAGPAAEPDAGPADAGPPDAAPGPDDGGASPVTDVHREHARRLSALVAGAVHGRDAFVVEVAATGQAVEIRHWREGALIRRQAVQHRLVAVPADEPSEFPEYLGENQPWQRLCPLVLAGLAQPQPDLGRALVVITVDAPLADLSLALRDGLVRDAALCLQDAGGIAILLDPANPIPWSELDGIE